MSTAIPSPTLGPTGYLTPAASDVLTGALADVNAAFGGNLNMALSTPQGQIASTIAAIVEDKNTQFLQLVNAVDPLYSSGKYQDALGWIYFMTREPAVASVCKGCTCVGLVGTVIPANAQAIDTSGNIWLAVVGGTIPASGILSLDFACATTGPIACPAGTLNAIYLTINGWNTITNPTDAVLGQNVETQQAFEFRRQNSVAVNGQGSLPSVYAAVFASAPVLNPLLRPTDVYCTENPYTTSQIIGGVTLTPNSIYVCAAAGDPTAIATAIWSKKSPGCNYATGIVFTGSTATSVLTVTAMTSGTLAIGQTISGLSIPNSSSFTASASTVVNYPLQATYIAPGYSIPVPALLAGAGITVPSYLTAQQSGAANGLGVYTVSGTAAVVASEGMTVTPISNITGSVTGSVLTVTATDSKVCAWAPLINMPITGGSIPGGTTITGQLTGTPLYGGISTGTYQLSASIGPIGSEAMVVQTSFAASIVANMYANNTYTLNVSAVSVGPLLAGQLVAGAGISNSPYIVAQLTGSAGSTGTYSLSVPVTVGSEAMTGTGATIPSGVTISSLGSGTGGTGTYNLSVAVGTSPASTLTAGTMIQVADTSYPVPNQPTYPVIFRQPVQVPILFAVNITNSASLPAGITTLVKNAIVSAFAGGDGGVAMRIGTKVNASRFYAPVAAISPTISIISVFVGTSVANLTSVPINIDQQPTITASNITVNLV